MTKSVVQLTQAAAEAEQPASAAGVLDVLHRYFAVPLAVVVVLLFTASRVGARETMAEWQARVDALKQELETKANAVKDALADCKLAQRKLDNVGIFINPFTEPARYEREYEKANSELKQAQDAWNRAVDEWEAVFRRYVRALNSPPR